MEGDSIIGGQQRDAQGEDRFRSWRTLENFDTVRDPVISLKMRKGYDRWNATELAASVRQLYVFKPTDNVEYLVAYLSDNNIYLITETGVHTRFYVGNNNMPARIPFLTVGDRLFFGTEDVGVGAAGYFWTDATAAAAGSSYRVNIAAFDVSGVTTTLFDRDINGTAPTYTASGDFTDAAGLQVDLAQGFNLGSATTFQRARLLMAITGSPVGRVRLRIETNAAGFPSDTLYTDDNFQSDWLDISTIATGGANFTFPTQITLPASTALHVRAETTDEYKDQYGTSAGEDKLTWSFSLANPYANGAAAIYNGTTWSNPNAGTQDFGVLLGGGLSANQIYHYLIVSYNSTYGIEGTAHTPPITVDLDNTTTNKGVTLGVLGSITQDAQSDQYRIYRTRGNAGRDGIYYLVTTIDDGDASFNDVLGDDSITVKYNNFLVQQLQDVDENRIAPVYLAHWNRRIWAIPANSSKAYFSDRLEEENAQGPVGESMYDWYGADNNWDFGSGIITGVRNFYDRLVFTFRDDKVRVLRGGDSSLNPPPDLFMEETINEEGSIDGYSMAEVLGSLVFVNSQKEVKVYRDGQFTQEANDINDSLWKPADIADTFMAANIDNQYWILVNRAAAAAAYDELWIFNASTTTKRWKVYRYDTELTSIVQLNDGTILASDAGSSYVLELNNTTSDNGTDITAIAETHSMMSENPRGRSRWNRISMSGNYPDANNFPAVTMNAIDRKAITTGKTVTPTGSDGVREHWTGLRVFSEECRSKITMVGISDNDIRRVWQGSTRDSAVISGGQDARRSV